MDCNCNQLGVVKPWGDTEERQGGQPASSADGSLIIGEADITLIYSHEWPINEPRTFQGNAKLNERSYWPTVYDFTKQTSIKMIPISAHTHTVGTSYIHTVQYMAATQELHEQVRSPTTKPSCCSPSI